MKITLTDAGKRFNRDWIFRHLYYEFTTSHTYAITGANGSGKSTLLQSIAGAIGISEGRISYAADQVLAGGAPGQGGPGSGERTGTGGPDAGKATDIAPDQAYRYLSLAAPYLEVIEEMTATEFLKFHASFKPFLPGWTVGEILLKVGLGNAAHKQVRFFSSGMRQRVRLAQAIFSDTPLLLLDEPCTNLDKDGIDLYRRLIEDHCKERTVIVSSNDVQEYDFCEKVINIMDYKS